MFANKKIIAIFASLVPAKPLHNAQIGGAFYFLTLMTPFTKGYSSPFGLVRLLISRGFIVNDELRAEAYIQNSGFLIAGWYNASPLADQKAIGRS